MKYSFELIDKKRVYNGFLKINRYRLRHDLYQGGRCQEIVRERMEELQASSVLLYDPLLDRVVLIEQFRIGALDQPGNPWVVETVGGYLGAGESPEEVARREALEEADCTIQQLEPICSFMVSPGISVDRIHLFCGLVDASHAGGVHGLDHEGEDIRVLVMDADQAIGELYDGRMNSTSVIIALQWLTLRRDELRQRWAISTKRD
ncbi:MAG: NUDIX domain-containing protein [Chromatiales bacterium]|jgi:ADP-ribose pyrophosphatase